MNAESLLIRFLLCGLATWILVIAWTPEKIVAQETTAKLEIIGIAVTMADPANEYGGSAVPGRMPGTEITLRASNDKMFVVGIVDDGDDASKLSIFDDSGKELESEGYAGGLAFRSSISEDGHSVSLPVTASAVPSDGTTRLHVRGTLVLVSASDEKTEDSVFEVAEGTEVKLGTISAKISELEEDPYGEPGLNISFESNKSFDTIAELTFLDESGQQLESSSSGGGSYGFNDQMTYQKNFTIKAKPKKMTVRVRYFEKTEHVKIDVDLPVTLGLGK